MVPNPSMNIAAQHLIQSFLFSMNPLEKIKSFFPLVQVDISLSKNKVLRSFSRLHCIQHFITNSRDCLPIFSLPGKVSFFKIVTPVLFNRYIKDVCKDKSRRCAIRVDPLFRLGKIHKIRIRFRKDRQQLVLFCFKNTQAAGRRIMIGYDLIIRCPEKGSPKIKIYIFTRFQFVNRTES